MLTSTLACTLLFFTYGLTRIVSLALDGVPALPPLRVMVAEPVIGAVGRFALRTAFRQQQANERRQIGSL